MMINCECASVRWNDFEIVNFYGVETCFTWNNEQLVVFPYKFEISTTKLSFIVAPKRIKSVHSYSGRVFILFKPCGIYKFNKNHEFVLFTNSAIGICAEFYKVLKVKENHLWLNNICEKTSIQLSKFSKVESQVIDVNEVCVLVIASQNIGNAFKLIFSLENDTDIYIIANGKNLFTLCGDNIQLIYTCQYNIIDVSAIKKQEETLGFLLKTDSHIIIVGFINDNTLRFKKINFGATIVSLVAEFSEKNAIFIVYSDGEKVHSIEQRFDSETVEKISCKNEKIINLKSYRGQILGLKTNASELIDLRFSVAETSHIITMDNFCELKSNMLKGSEVIVNNICEQAKQLNIHNEKLLIEHDKLKRINIFAHKQRISSVPKIQVNRMVNSLFLKVTFDHSLPHNSKIFINLMSGNQTQFCSKLILDREITVEMPLIPEMLEYTLNLSIDLVTLSEENQPWCLIRNCTVEPTLRDRTRIRQLLNDKKKFINAKLNALLNIIPDDNGIDIKLLSDIKKNIRRDITDL